jgi:Mor family transcriptional regulator
MGEMKQLEPCPWQKTHKNKDRTAIGLQIALGWGGQEFYYACGECQARGPKCRSQEEAFAAWNGSHDPELRRTK